MPLLYKFDELNLTQGLSSPSIFDSGGTSRHKEIQSFTTSLKNCETDDSLIQNLILKTDDQFIFLQKNSDGETALSIALYRGSIAVCEVLLNKGCDVNQVASFPPFGIKMSPLSYAVTQSNKKMVELLLNYGGDPTITDDFGRSPVQCAICCGHTEILKLFLDRGCDPNTRIPETTQTLLHEACYRDNYESVKYLSDAGADPNLYEFNGRTIPAFHSKKLSIHKLLYKCGSDLNWRTRSGETILHSSVTLRYYDLVEFFLQNGAIMDFTQTVIMYGRENMANFIQRRGLLQLALKEQHCDIILLLIKYGYEINLKSDEWQLFTMLSGNVEVLGKARQILSDDQDCDKCKIKDFEHFHTNDEINGDGSLENCQSLSDTCRKVIRRNLAFSCPKTSFYYKLKQISYFPEKLIKFVIYE